MHCQRLLSGLCLLLLNMVAMAQESTPAETTETLPSAEFLEFLADFGAIDNKTYELIEYHALQDSSKQQQEPSDEH